MGTSQSKISQGEQPASGRTKATSAQKGDGLAAQGPVSQQAQHRPDTNSPAKQVPAEVAQMQAAMKKQLEAARGDADQMRAALRAQMAERDRQEQEQRRVDEAKAKRAKLAEQWKRDLEEAC